MQHFWLFSRQTDGLFLKKNALDDFQGGVGRGEKKKSERRRGSVGQHLDGMFFKATVHPKAEIYWSPLRQRQRWRQFLIRKKKKQKTSVSPFPTQIGLTNHQYGNMLYELYDPFLPCDSRAVQWIKL